MWNGKETFKCNGKFTDFSIMMSRAYDDIGAKFVIAYDVWGRKIVAKYSRFWDIVYGSFKKAKIEEEKYWF